MDQSFDANRLTSDLKQMLKLSESPTKSDPPTNDLSQNSENIHSNSSQSRKSQMDLKSTAPTPADITKNVSSDLDTCASLSKSNTQKSRKKKKKENQGMKRQEKSLNPGKGKSLSSSEIDNSKRSDLESDNRQDVRNNPSMGKNSPVITLPSKNKSIGNLDSSKSRTMQNSAMKQQTPESNDNSDAGAGKNKYDDVSRQIQIKLDQNKIFFLKNRNARFPNAKYFCRYCDYHMDTIEICEKHMEESKHCHKKEVGCMDSTLRRIPPPALNHKEAITEAINTVCEEHGIKPEDRDVRRAIVQRLEKEIQKDIPDIALHMYGSSLTCMGLKTSDINVNLTSTDKDKKLTTLLKEIYSLLKDCTGNGFNNVHSDFSASVPVLFINDIETGYKLNIAIHVYSSLCTSELLSMYSDFDERTIKLTIAFRYWAYLSGIDRHSAGFIPPIALNIMVIFFLQTVKPSVLPIICPPVVCGEESKDFTKDKAAFQSKRDKVMSRKSELNNDMSVGELWVRLLRFYTIELDIPDVVISIRSASPISRRNKPWNSRKLAVEEPYMLKNLTRMLTRCYEYWQYTIRKAYHYFGLPRGPGGRSYLPDYNFPDELEEANVSQSKGSTKEEENTSDKNEENCTQNGAGNDSLPGSDCDSVVVEKDNNSATKFENLNGALNSSSSKMRPASQESDISSVGKDKIHPDSHAAEISSPSHLDQSLSPIGAQTDVGTETKHCDSHHSFILNYVDSLVENVLDLVSQKASASSPSQSLPLPSSQNADSKQSHKDVGGSLGIKTEDKTCKEKTDITRKGNICSFTFNKDYLTSKNEPAMVCVICEKEGHHKNECPDDVLPEVLPVQGFTEHHHKILEQTLKKMPSEVGLSDISFRERQMFLKCLEDFIQVGFPGARLHLFGSSCNGFGFDRSDMDICMTFVKKRPNIDKVFAVERLANILMVHKDLKNVQAIPTAKVPIVKFTIKNIELDGDISLYNTLAQENTHLLHSYSVIDPRVQILGYTIKMFAQVCDIGDASRGSLSSYGYILMMLYYLQQVKPPVIPVLQELHNFKAKPRKIVEGWDAWFMSDLTQLPKLWPEMGQNKMSVAELWFGFLRFYVEEFNYRELVISIRQLEPLTRFDKLWNGFCLAIEDPFDLNHNLGSGLTRSMNNFILKTFINGRMLYGSPIDDNMELFNKYQTPSDYFFDTELLSEARPTTSRGCRCCGKIGHLIRHCPIYKKEKEDEQQKRNVQEKQRFHNQQPHNVQSDHRSPPRSSFGKDQQQRQHQLQYHRSQDQQSQHYDHSVRKTPEMQGHYSPRDDRHPSQRQQQQQKNKSLSFQQQETQKIQKRLERDLFGDRSRGPDPRQDNRPLGGQGHHYNPHMNMGNTPYIRPTTVSPAINQRHPVPDRNISHHQYPPSLRPRSGGVDNSHQFPVFNNPPPGLVPPFHFNFPNTFSSGSTNRNNMMNANNVSNQRMPMRPPHNYMNMSAAQGPGNTGVPPLLTHPGASHSMTRGMSPVVQNLFASTQGKVLDVRMIHPNAMKKN